MRHEAALLSMVWVFLFTLGLLLPRPNVFGARVAGEKGVTSVSPGDSGDAASPPARSPALKKPIPGNKKAVPKETPEKGRGGKTDRGDRYVTIDFDNVDIGVFIKFISELSGKNFVVDKAVKGDVTIISPNKISVKEAYKVFESVLEVHGYTTVPAGNIIKIVPAASAKSKDIETRLRRRAITAEDKVVTQLIPLKYADPDRLQKLFTPCISKSSIIVSYPPTGTLIVTDVLSNIKRLLSIVEAIDVEGIGEEISVVPLLHATASVMAKSLNAVFQKTPVKTRKGMTPTALLKVVPDERTNTLIILASEDDTVRIRRLIELLDKETPRGEGDIRVYYLRNANAEDLAKVLMAIPSKQSEEAKKGKAPLLSKNVQIVADKATNALVITSNKADYLVLEDVIKKLDIVRPMVYIEALIMEVDVDKEFDLGVRWEAIESVGSHEGRSIAGFGASVPPKTPSSAVPSESGFSLGLLSDNISIGGVAFPNIRAVVRAFQNDVDVNIISTPQIMTTDNEEAEIVVAENRPFLTSQQRTTTEIDYSNYEYKDVGVILKITPQISQNRFVRLKLSQEVSNVVEEMQLGLPVTLKRTANTTVVIKDSHTIVIGGLIDRTLNESTYKVPVLGDIPLLGLLFRSRSKSDKKTNLFIFLTPHIVETPAEAEDVYREKKEAMDRVKEGTIKMYGKEKDKSPEPAEPGTGSLEEGNK